MKKRIPSFDDFNLSEAAYLPDTNFVVKELNSNRSKLSKAKDIAEVDDILNKMFNDNWILVLTSETDSEECLYPKWAIDTANTRPNDQSPSGSVVTIVLGKDFFDKLKGIKNNTEWKQFVGTFESAIAHEYVHKFQVKKIPPEFHGWTIS